MSLSPDTQAALRAARAEHRDAQATILPALQIVQAAHGWVSDAHLAEAAAVIGATEAEMDDLATFYPLIFRRPVGDRVILLCDAVSCWLNGADAVRDAVEAALGVGPGQTTADGRYTLIDICCVGACDRAPCALVGADRRVVGPLAPDDLSALWDDA